MKRILIVSAVAAALAVAGAAAYGLRRGDVPRAVALPVALPDVKDAHLREILDAEAVYSARVRLEQVGDRDVQLILRGVDGGRYRRLPAEPLPKGPIDALRFVFFRLEDGSLMCPLPYMFKNGDSTVDAEATLVIPKTPSDGAAPQPVLYLTISYAYRFQGQIAGQSRSQKSFRFACDVPTGDVYRFASTLGKPAELSTRPLSLFRCAIAAADDGMRADTPGVELLASLVP